MIKNFPNLTANLTLHISTLAPGRSHIVLHHMIPSRGWQKTNLGLHKKCTWQKIERQRISVGKKYQNFSRKETPRKLWFPRPPRLQNQVLAHQVYSTWEAETFEGERTKTDLVNQRSVANRMYRYVWLQICMIVKQRQGMLVLPKDYPPAMIHS